MRCALRKFGIMLVMDSRVDVRQEGRLTLKLSDDLGRNWLAQMGPDSAVQFANLQTYQTLTKRSQFLNEDRKGFAVTFNSNYNGGCERKIPTKRKTPCSQLL